MIAIILSLLVKIQTCLWHKVSKEIETGHHIFLTVLAFHSYIPGIHFTHDRIPWSQSVAKKASNKNSVYRCTLQCQSTQLACTQLRHMFM